MTSHNLNRDAVNRVTEKLDVMDKKLDVALSIYQASAKWYWRLLAGIIALATLASAVFEALSYFRG